MIVGIGGFDPEAFTAPALASWRARLTALLTGPCAGYMANRAALITPPPPPDPSIYYDPGYSTGGGGDGAL